MCKDDLPNRYSEKGHLYSLVYKFFSPVTKLRYILRAEYHQEDIFVVKFYVQSHHQKRRYSTITNRGDFCNIIITCCKIVPLLLKENPNVSFGFMGGRTLDSKHGNKSKRIEGFDNNQRFRIYKDIASQKFGNKTFAHIEYKIISSYLLLNRKCLDLKQREMDIKTMFVETYSDILDIDI